jgi:hypothetical protein
MILDPIILSNNKSISTKSRTNYSILDIDLTTKNDSNSLYITDIKLADNNGFASGVAFTSNCLVVDYQDI